MGKKITDVPYLLKMWDFELNTDKPKDVSVHLEDKRFWKCQDCGYSWQASVKSRYKSSGKCPCHESNKVIMKGVNDALTVVKGLSDLLDDDNDFDLISTQGIDSSVPINLFCKECGRKWTVSLRTQVRKLGNSEYISVGCPHYNTIKRKKDDVPFCIDEPKLSRFWDDNNSINPRTTKSNSTEKAHFICKNCGYDWTTQIITQVKGTGKCKCCELQRVTKKGVTDVFTLVPKSKDYFDFNKNKNIDIYSIPLRNTNTLIDWKCPDCSYEWQAPLASRIDGKQGSYSFRGCHQCYLHGVERITPVSSVSKLVEYWDFKKNKDKDVNLTSAYSYASAFWRCKECGYEWEETLKSFNGRYDGCPYCDGKRNAIMKGKNDALSVCPDLAQIYDFEANKHKGIDIYSLGAKSRISAHFKCNKCNYEWDSSISTRIKFVDGNATLVDCPECSNKLFRQIPYSEEYPDLAKMYRKDLNSTPLDSIRGARAVLRTYYYWDCLICGETFNSVLSAMTQSYASPTKGCPYCSHTKLRKGESFGDLHPDIMDEYDDSNDIDAYTVFPNDARAVKWVCRDCGYRWDATFALRHTGGGKCHRCFRTVVIKDENSFAAVYPDYIKYWANSNNNKADEVFADSSEYHSWHCFECEMDYRATINEFINNKSCPYCSEKKAIPGKTSLKALYPDIAKLLSPNDGRDADYILPNVKSSYLWLCPACKYEYNATAFDMTHGYDCPYCNNRQLLRGFNSFGDRHQNLLLELNEIANYLLPYTPFDVLDTSNKKFWWTCPKDSKHKYPMSPSTRLMFQKRDREPCLYCRGQRRKLSHFVHKKF